MNKQKIQKITLDIFYPAMFITAFVVLFGIWAESIIELPDTYFKLIPTFLIIGIASIICWGISIIRELVDIARNRK